MDIRKIKKLIDLLEDSNLSEIEIQEGEESIRLSRTSQIAAPMAAPVSAPVAPAAAPATAPAAEEKPAADVPEGEEVKSPMVGTYYSASKPGAPDFVKLGDKVAVGDVLCIVEAMKIFNQIEAEKAGTIVAINKESGDPVEYGEPLFIIK